jgi:hypothetical protein
VKCGVWRRAGVFRVYLHFSSLKRRTGACVDGEVKGKAGRKGGLRSDPFVGFAGQPLLLVYFRRFSLLLVYFGAYPVSGAPEFGFSALGLVNTPKIGDTTCVFHDHNMFSANMGARGCGGRCR